MTVTRELAERVFGLYNSGDVDAFLDAYHPDAILRVPEGNFEGRAAIREFWAAQFSEFPDSHIASELVLEQDNVSVAEFTYTGTNTGPLTMDDGSSLPPTGKRIEMKGMQLLEFRDGKIVRHAVYHDEVTAMAQLGLMPASLTV